MIFTVKYQSIISVNEQFFGSGAKRFEHCVEIKIAELDEKHKDFRSQQNINLNEGLYTITFNPGGGIGFRSIRDISNEIDGEINRILKECAEEHLQKL